MDINIKVSGRYAQFDGVAGVVGENNATILKISFDSTWDAYTEKNISFEAADGTGYAETPIPENGYPLPADLVKVAGNLHFIIWGHDGSGTVFETYSKTLKVAEGIKPGTTTPQTYIDVVALCQQATADALAAKGAAEQTNEDIAAAELLREQAEGERQQGETDRDNAYTIAESARNTAYNTAEDGRNTAYGNAEDARDAAEAIAKAARDNVEAEAKTTRDNTEAQAKTTRDNNAVSAEQARQTTFNNNEVSRNSIYQEVADARGGQASLDARLDLTDAQLAAIDAYGLFKTATGNPVSIVPVEGRAIVLSIAASAVQSGSGDPSPSNVRPFTRLSTINIANTNGSENNGKEVSPSSVVGGTSLYPDIITVSKEGAVTVTHNTASTVFSGAAGEGWAHSYTSGNIIRFYATLSSPYADASNVVIAASHFVGKVYGNLAWTAEGIAADSTGLSRLYLNVLATTIGVSTGETDANKVVAMKSWLASNPVTVVYRKATPTAENLGGTSPLLGLLGTNTISCDSGCTLTVLYNADLTAYNDAFQIDYAAEKVKIANTRPRQSGKVGLLLGDSTTYYGTWQLAMAAAQECTYVIHALGGAKFKDLLDGVSTLPALTTTDVTGKDFMVILAGINEYGVLKGTVGDLYPTQNTVAGRLQYLLNGIYALLTTAGNLTCKVLVVAPYCYGPNGTYTIAGDVENPAGSGQTFRDVCDIICSVAENNNCRALNLWRTSGIGRKTWAVYGKQAGDYVHLNNAGYARIGGQIGEEMNRL